MPAICCIGHITADKVVTPAHDLQMPGGTAWYFSQAIANLDVDYVLVTSLGKPEMNYVDLLRDKGVEVLVHISKSTVKFENIYGHNPDERTQNVTQKAEAFTVDQLQNVDSDTFHLGPLLAGDIPLDLIKFLASKGKVSLDVQGYLREVIDQKVYTADWPEKKETLQYIDILKADEAELRALTGCETVNEGVKLLASWGVKEAVITNGSNGSIIYCNGEFYTIPAYPAKAAVDATGCGDTYMAGYLYERFKGFDIQRSGEFAAAMAALKMEFPGPFTGTENDVSALLKRFNHRC